MKKLRIISPLLLLSCFCKFEEKDQYDFRPNITDTTIVRIQADSCIELEIDPANYVKNIIASQLFNVQRIIKLPETTRNLISNITKIISFNKFILILDKANKTIYNFNKDENNFKWIYSESGQGPGEIVEISDIQIINNAKSQMVLLWDGRSNKIVYLDLINGRFIKESKKIGIIAETFAPLSLDTMIFYNSGFIGDPILSTKLISINLNNNSILNRYFRYENNENLSKIMVENNLYFQNQINKFSFTFPFDNNIYTINNEQISISYCIDFGKYNYDTKSINFNIDLAPLFKKIFDPTKAGHFSNILILKDYLVFNYLYSGKRIYVLYHKVNKTITQFNELKDDVFGDLLNIARIFPASDPNNFYIILDPDELQYAFIAFDKYPDSKHKIDSKLVHEYEDLRQNLSKKTSNPIIVEVSLL